MNGKRWIFLAVVILLLMGCSQEQGTTLEVIGTPVAVEEDETDVPTPTAVRTGVTIFADGAMQAIQPALFLGFETGGKLLTVNVQAGDVVQAGDLIAVLDDEHLVEAVTNAELAVDQAENSLAQTQLALDDLLSWEPDDMAVSVAEANLEAAEANYDKALSQDAVAGNSLTSARVSLEQAERSLAEAQEKYDNAWDEARDWELNYNEPVCHPGQGGSIPCTGITWRQRIENDREGTTRGLQGAQDNLTLARANYNLAQAGLNSNSALNAETGVVSAQQALDQATRGPKAEEIEAAQLRVEQAEISLEQSQLILTQADNALADTELIAPWSGTVLSVETAPGALVGGGSPIVRLLDLTQLEFHTTNLSERDLAQIAPGQTAVITLKAYPNDPLAGTVQRIDLQAGKMVGDAATFPVIIVLDAVALDIRPGMTGRTEISRGE